MQERKIDISIVIVNYNVKDFLLQCLRSIEEASKNLNVETIVVDNDSNDGSVDFLEPLFPEVDFIALNENIGFAKANNKGIEIAKGKYVLILNPDTILQENTLEIMLRYMESDTETGIAGCKVLNPDGSFQVQCRRGFPTPWASFSKLFGLQKLFPKSKFFAKYNQTFRSTEETYYIDAVIGAFMFCRKEALDQIGGFDTDFFMYAEDIDLCYRTQKSGWKIAYVHETSIIHYKGESTKRSSINEVRHFYNAMEIFANKHYSRSGLFLIFLRIGILIRSLMAYASKYSRDLSMISFDLISVNASLLIATKYRFGNFFNFPDYAYPTVFFVISAMLLIANFSSGDYFESKTSARRTIFGHMAAFFVLSSLTYFFKENWGFSRGVLLMSMGMSMMFSAAYRVILNFRDRNSGNKSNKRIAILGNNKQSRSIIRQIKSSGRFGASIAGIIESEQDNHQEDDYPLIGSAEYMQKIIEQYDLNEIIITDDKLSRNQIIKMIENSSHLKVRFHVAHEYEELVAAKITNEIAGIEPTLPNSKLLSPRYRLIKRLSDIAISLFLLSLGRIVLYLLFVDKQRIIKDLWLVLRGKKSIVGIYPLEEKEKLPVRAGIIGLAHLSGPESLTKDAIEKLNSNYFLHYSMALDFDIMLKYIFRKKSG